MAGEHITIRSLTAADRQAVAGLQCVIMPRRWERVLPELVELIAADLSSAGGISAVGAFDGTELVGIAGWQTVAGDASGWSVLLVAVRLGHQRKHIATRLKVEILDRARDAGIEYVMSRVHSENDAMLTLNGRLGAELIAEPPTDWYGFYYTCIIPVPAG